MSETETNKEKDKPKVSKLAVVSLVVAVLGAFTVFLTAPIAFILAVLSIFNIQKSKGKLKGAGFAITALVIAQAGAVWFIYVGMPRIRSISPSMVCGTNLSQLGKAMHQYAIDNNGRYPSSYKWCDLLIKHTDITEKNLRCYGEKEQRCGYAMNHNCYDMNSPPNMVLLFDAWSLREWNLSGELDLATFRHHEGESCNILFNDGHVEGMGDVLRISELNWGDEQKQ
ncbi:hypothetical protein ACFL1G_10845 [Planctomycetota bacterium]